MKSTDMTLPLSPEDKLVLSSIKLISNEVELFHLENLLCEIKDWDYLCIIAIKRGIGQLVYNKISQLKNQQIIPEDTITKLKSSYYNTLTRNMLLQSYLINISKSFNIEEIAFIPLKGIYLSVWLYGDIGLRQMSDIDLLIKPEDVERCKALLITLGFKASVSHESEIVVKSKEEAIHCTPMIKNGVSIELHTILHRKTDVYKLNIDKIWVNSNVSNISDTLIRFMSNTDLLIYLCIHLDRHFIEGKIQFTSYADITNLIEKLRVEFNWNSFEESCKVYNCIEVVFKHILLSQKYMNAYVPHNIVEKYSYILTNNVEVTFYNLLIGKYKPFSAIPFHFSNIEGINSKLDKFRYIIAIVFPPKEFMISKYIENKEQRAKSKEGKKNTSSHHHIITSSHHHIITSRFWWLWYGYRWWVAVKAVVKIAVRGKW